MARRAVPERRAGWPGHARDAQGGGEGARHLGPRAPRARQRPAGARRPRPPPSDLSDPPRPSPRTTRTRRVRLVSPPPPLGSWPAGSARAGAGAEQARPGATPRRGLEPRANRTCLVPFPVLTGHVSSLPRTNRTRLVPPPYQPDTSRPSSAGRIRAAHESPRRCVNGARPTPTRAGSLGPARGARSRRAAPPPPPRRRPPLPPPRPLALPSPLVPRSSEGD